MAKPVFVLLHGAWHLPQCWNRVIPLLEKHGYEAVAPHLPSSGSTPPIPDWNADIDVIRSTVSDLAKERDVVVVMHSNSGITGGTALSGLDKKPYTDKGWKGGVVRLIYICAFTVPEGFQHSAPGTRDNMVEEMKVDFHARFVTVLPEDVKGLMYQELPDEEALEVARTLVPQSLGGVWSTTTDAAWRYIPTTYVITLKDKSSTVAAAEYLVKSAMESEPNCVEKVVRREVGHAPFWSQPEWTAEMLMEEAGPESGV